MTPMADGTARRGWCPGVRRPMATGDGLLVRVHPPGGALTTAEARLLAEAARAHGNGLLDVTGRGNLQIRGVTEATHPALAARLEAAALAEAAGAGPHRLTIVSPLAGLDPLDRLDARALAAAVDAEAGRAPGLPAKICVAVDGGGTMPLAGTGADIHLVAVGAHATPAVAVGLAAEAGPLWIGTASLGRAPAAVGVVLARMAATGRRMRDLDPEARAEIAGAAELGPVMLPAPRPAGPQAGLLALSDGSAALLLGLPFGRCTADQLAAVADWAERRGRSAIRLSFTRGLLLPGIAPADAPDLMEPARDAGLIVDAADPRLRIKACPGAPACASARAPAQQDAARLARSAAALLGRPFTVHVSGCAKGCAHPARADLTLVGGEDRAYGVVLGGGTRDAPAVLLPFEEIARRLEHVRSTRDLALAFGELAA